MKSAQSPKSNWALFLQLACGLFVLLGITSSLLYLGGAFVAYGLLVLPRQKLHGIVMIAFGAVYFTMVLGYGIGKDMALRDNARTVSQTSTAES